MSTPDLERLARETAARIEQAQRDYLNAYPSEATPVDLEGIILTALHTAQQATNEDTAELKALRDTIRKAMTAFCEDASDGKAAAKMFTILASAAIDQARREGK